MVDLDARAGGNQRLALCNHFCLFHPSPFPPSSSSSSHLPTTLGPPSRFIQDAHVCSRGRAEGAAARHTHAVHTIALVGVHTNSGRAGDGITLCRCVYEHARATGKRSGRDAEEQRIDPARHTLLRVVVLLLLLLSSRLARHTSA